mgnify:CR=1 FL=1
MPGCKHTLQGQLLATAISVQVVQEAQGRPSEEALTLTISPSSKSNCRSRGVTHVNSTSGAALNHRVSANGVHHLAGTAPTSHP